MSTRILVHFLLAALNAECPAQLEIGRGPRCLSAAASFPNRTTYGLGDSGRDSGPSSIDQRAVADAGFLKLVRLGIKPADDGVIINSLKVVDTQLATTTPNGIFWHRYNFDGYGETEKGRPWGVNSADSFITVAGSGSFLPENAVNTIWPVTTCSRKSSGF